MHLWRGWVFCRRLKRSEMEGVYCVGGRGVFVIHVI